MNLFLQKIRDTGVNLNLEKIPWRGALRRPRLATALGMVVGLVLCWALLARPDAATDPVAEPALLVPEGSAGKAGDLVVTEEALELAEIRTAPPEVKSVQEKLGVTGIIQTGGDRIAKITPAASGKVVKLVAGVGDDVAAGETLALLESTELARLQAAYAQAAARARALESHLEGQRELARLGEFGRPPVEESRTRAVDAERDARVAERHLAEEETLLSEAESELGVLESLVAQAQTELEVQSSRLTRAESLEELVARQDLERIRADFQKARAEVEVARTRVSQGRARIAGGKERVAAAAREAALARQRWTIAGGALEREEKVFSGRYRTSRELVEAQTEFQMAQVEREGAAESVRLLGGTPGRGSRVALVSPISGRVQECSATLGETVDPQHVAYTIVNLDQVWAQLAVAPKELPRVKVGNPVELEAESSPGRVFRGRITHVSAAADKTTRTVYLRTSLNNPEAALKAGTFVRGELITDVRHERLAVPDGALQEHTGRPTLYVALPGQPGAFEVRHVTLGARGDGWREVSEGLKAGEPVAVSGTFYLKSEALKSSLSDGCCAVGK